MALVVAVTAGAQGTTIYEYPWNPDSNNDNLIGVDDLLDFLPVFGDEFGNPPEPCDYDGTPLEDLVIGIADGSIVLDSMFIEYELEDVSTYYVLGCPDPVTDTLIFSNSMMLDNIYFSGGYWECNGTDSYSHLCRIRFHYDTSLGTYFWSLYGSAIDNLGFENDGFFGAWASQSDSSPIPLPEDWFLNEEGIHIESGWDENDWPYYANYIHILPYWHYAE